MATRGALFVPSGMPLICVYYISKVAIKQADNVLAKKPLSIGRGSIYTQN